ncbi:MAG: sensor histidine kinase [Actinobacteria bacterium]|nr:MAG: sensor histidine kinase [Actinomycetota bacterium]
MPDTPWYRRLFTQTLAIQFVITALVLAVAAIAFARQAQITLEEQYGLRSLAVAESVAAMPIVRDNVADPDSPPLLQPVAEAVREATEVSFVVIADVAGIRRSHPSPERIGLAVSTDPSETLAGVSGIYTQTGTLGRSVRGKAPIFDHDGDVIGLVSVGVLSVTVAEAFRDDVPAVLLGSAIAMAVGAVGAWFLARRIRRQTLGLEPADIAAILERREAMLLGIREGVVGLDAEGCINLVNHEGTHLLGITEDNLGDHLVDAVPSVALERLLAEPVEYHDVDLTISERALVANVTPISVRGHHVGTVLTLRDRTEIESLVGELESVQELVEALRAQAHEFSNTLHTISGMIEMERTSEVVDLISDHTDTHERLTAAFESTLPDSLVVGLLIAKSAIAAERGIRFSVEIVGFEDCSLVGSRELIPIIGNLVDNAFDSVAGPRDGGAQVGLSMTRDGDTLELAVLDNGEGIAPAVRAKMFDEGFTTKGTDAHAGIGLSLVQNAVTAAGGSISIEHNNGAGFRVRIPHAFVKAESLTP